MKEKHQVSGYISEIHQLNFMSASVVFDGYQENLAKNENAYKCCLGKRISPTILFDPTTIFQRKKEVFL